MNINQYISFHGLCENARTLYDIIQTNSRIIDSNAAVSSACFCVCKAIFSLNFLGFAMMAACCGVPSQGVNNNFGIFIMCIILS